MMASYFDSSSRRSNTYLEVILTAELEDHVSPFSCSVCGIEDLKEIQCSFVRGRVFRVMVQLCFILQNTMNDG